MQGGTSVQENQEETPSRSLSQEPGMWLHWGEVEAEVTNRTARGDRKENRVRT